MDFSGILFQFDLNTICHQTLWDPCWLHWCASNSQYIPIQGVNRSVRTSVLVYQRLQLMLHTLCCQEYAKRIKFKYFFFNFNAASLAASVVRYPYIYITRSTQRAQTSATHSLKCVKQSTQVWSSAAYCFLPPYPENFTNVHPSGIPWCCQQTRTQKIQKGTLCPRGYTDHPQNVPDCSLCHSQTWYLKISWKSTHRFYRGVANKHPRGA